MNRRDQLNNPRGSRRDTYNKPVSFYEGMNDPHSGLEERFRDENFSERTLSHERRPMSGHKRGHHAMNFEQYASEGNHFIHQVARELGTNRDQAARITRAVLHAIRDRIPPIDAVQFGQGLPMALKGVYFDQYTLAHKPVVIRRADVFLRFVRDKNRFAAVQDFPNPEAVIKGLQAVFRVLEMHMDPGQVDQIKHILHSDILKLIEPSELYQ